jgi:hypothetical protein
MMERAKERPIGIWLGRPFLKMPFFGGKQFWAGLSENILFML